MSGGFGHLFPVRGGHEGKVLRNNRTLKHFNICCSQILEPLVNIKSATLVTHLNVTGPTS